MSLVQATAASSVAALVALTPAARGALGARHEIRITKFPFKAGRESRLSDPTTPALVELRLGVAPQLDDVYLLEPSTDLLQISREHFAIQHEGDQFFVVDRGSVCGTIVAGTRIGGNRVEGRTELRSGDVIIVGTSTSEYVFRFELKPTEIGDERSLDPMSALKKHQWSSIDVEHGPPG